MKNDILKPCDDCPMRRIAIPGWLGADDTEGFMRSIMNDCEMPCHQTVDYEDDDWKAKLPEAQHCAGVAIFFANICKLSQDRNRQQLPEDREHVFASPNEFIEYHNMTYEEWRAAKGLNPKRPSARYRKGVS